MGILLTVKDLSISIKDRNTGIWKRVVNDLNYQVMDDEFVGIVGESGSGKSISVLAIINLTKAKNIKVEGSINFNGHEMLELPEHELQKIRGKEVCMIFQDPLNCLNPLLKIKTQMVDILRSHKKISKKEALDTAIRTLDMVGITLPEKRINSYPFELSGGMIQRVMIAMAIMGSPRLIIADEPTTALDATTQQQILGLLKEVCKKNKISMIFISHNLDIVSEICNRIMVMYSGEKIEELSVDDLYIKDKIIHPYTKSLLDAIPKFDLSNEDFFHLENTHFDIDNMDGHNGCVYAPKCSKANKICLENKPDEAAVGKRHRMKCRLASTYVES